MSQLKFKFKLIKVWMVCFRFEPGVAEWKVHMSYGGTPSKVLYHINLSYLRAPSIMLNDLHKILLETNFHSIPTLSVSNWVHIIISVNLDRGQVVSVLSFYPDDPSLNPAEVYSFFSKIYVWKERK